MLKPPLLQNQMRKPLLINKKIHLALAFLLLCQMACTGKSEKSKPTIGRLLEIKGVGDIRLSEDSTFVAGVANSEIFDRAQLRTAKNSQMLVQLTNGYTFWLKELSDVSLERSIESAVAQAVTINIAKGDLEITSFGAAGALKLIRGLKSVDPATLAAKEIDKTNTKKSMVKDLSESVEVSRDASLSNEMITQEIGKQKNSLENCVLNSLRESKTSAGNLMTHFTIHPNGKTSSVSVSQSSFHDKAFEICISRVIERITFQSFAGEDILVNYPFSFQ